MKEEEALREVKAKLVASRRLGARVKEKLKPLIKEWKKRILEDKIKHYPEEEVWADIRYCVLEMIHFLEEVIDDVIKNKYIGGIMPIRENIALHILPYMDFSRKLTILEKIKKNCKTRINIGKIRHFIKIRNSLMHLPTAKKNILNYDPKDFQYNKGHIYYDLTIVDLLNDMLKTTYLLVELRDEIAPKSVQFVNIN